VGWDGVTRAELLRRAGLAALAGRGVHADAGLTRSTSLAPTGTGVVTLSADDGLGSIVLIASELTRRGLAGTFNVISDLIGQAGHASATSVARIAAQGHEIGSHSKTHPHLATGGLTLQRRVAEYDASKAAIEKIVGAGSCRTFAYPYGDYNATTQTELYLRYDVVVSDLLGGVYSAVGAYVPRDEHGWALVPRLLWSNANHAVVLELIQEVAARALILNLVIHGIADAGETDNPLTLANLRQGLDAAAALNVPVAPVHQAHSRQSSVLTDPGFELTTTDMLNGAASSPWKVELHVGDDLGQRAADVPAAGLTGTQSLHLHTDDTGGAVAASQAVFLSPGTSYTLSGRCRALVSGGGGHCYVGVREYDTNGGYLLTNNPVYVTSSSWQQQSWSFTTTSSTRLGKLIVEIDKCQADLYADHLHLGETALMPGVTGPLG
jgi:peptidoglycan/xylan/chitin deacetylase (PgdA/CDA1 family)